VQQKENLALIEAVKIINQTLSAQCSKIIDESKQTILSQTMKIKELENIIEQNTGQMNNLKTNQDLMIQTDMIQTELIQHLKERLNHQDEQINILIKHDKTTNITSEQVEKTTNSPNNYTERMLESTKTISEQLEKTTNSPKNYTERMLESTDTISELFRATWDEANRNCTNFGTSLLSYNINTIEKRQSLCKTYGVNDVLWTGIQKTETYGRWKYPDGKLVFVVDELFEYDSFLFPSFNDEFNFMAISCLRNENFGEVFDFPKERLFYFACEN